MAVKIGSAFGVGSKLVVGGTLALVAIACTPYGNYRVVKKQPNTAGEVALEGDQNLARQKAEGYMKAECNGGYDIVEEGEEVTGSTSSSSQNSDTRPQKNIFGQKSMNTQTHTNTNTVNTREWRVKYKCKSGGEAPPTEKASTPAPTDPQKKSEIREVIVRF